MTKVSTIAALRAFIQEHTHTLVKFTAPWCAPCRAFAPILERALGEMPNPPALVVFDLGDSDPKSAGLQDMPWRVKGIPTLVYFRSGKILRRTIGSMGLTQTREWLKGSKTDEASPKGARGS